MSNIKYGLFAFGRYRFGEPVRVVSVDPGGTLPDDKIAYVPGVYTVIAYAPDGTKTAIFGAGAAENALDRVRFEMVDTGCGAFELMFRRLPTETELNYKQRVDIHLYNDPRPWYSGYVIARPVEGTTATEYVFKGHGYYNQLEKIIINETYEKTEISAIVADIARKIERDCGLVFNRSKIVDTGYTVEKIEFDHITAKEALKQLADFAVNYVYGVDEYRQLYFRPRVDEINEQARFWVGKHVAEYIPEWDVEKIVNRAYIKGGRLDDGGEQWLTTVEDKESREKYGLNCAVWSLPSAYEVADAERWGRNQLKQHAEPVKSAKITGVRLEYPKPNGAFFVRKLSTQGRAAVTTLSGAVHTYPIKELKYEITGARGVSVQMVLGTPPFSVDKYLFNIERNAKIAEMIQQAATRQLKLEKIKGVL